MYMLLSGVMVSSRKYSNDKAVASLQKQYGQNQYHIRCSPVCGLVGKYNDRKQRKGANKITFRPWTQ